MDALAISWEFWAIAGLTLLILDIAFGAAGNFAALSVACFLTSGLAALANLTGMPLVPGWPGAAMEFVLFSFVTVAALRHIVRRRSRHDHHDVNRY